MTASRTLLLAAALTLGQAGALTVIKIATIGPLSGPQSFIGTQQRDGARMAVNEFKAQFKKLGFDLQLVPYDDQADPATGTAVARKIAADRSFLAVVGAVNSGVSIPVSLALRPARLAMVTSSSTANEFTDRGLSNVNRIVPRDDAQGPAGADFLAGTLKAKSVYIINDRTAYGAGLAGEVAKRLTARGVKVITNEGTEEKSDFSSLIAKIKLRRPDAIYFGGIYSQAGVFLKQLREAGLTLPMVGGDGFDASELAKIAGKSADNVYYTTIAAPVESQPATKAFGQRFKAAYKADAQPYAVSAYDAGRVVAQGVLNAVKAAGNKLPSRAQVESAIRRGSYGAGLLSGPVQFNSAGDRKAAKLYVIRVSGGKATLSTTVTVKPPKP